MAKAMEFQETKFDNAKDFIAEVEKTFGVRDFIHKDTLQNELSTLRNAKRLFKVSSESDTRTVSTNSSIQSGRIIGVIKGDLLKLNDEELTKIKKFPVLMVNFMHDNVRTGVDTDASLYIKKLSRTRSASTTCYAVNVTETDNPLALIQFTNNINVHHNSRVRFMDCNNKIYLCVFADGDVVPGEPIVAFSSDVTLLEDYVTFVRRTEGEVTKSKEKSQRIKKTKSLEEERETLQPGTNTKKVLTKSTSVPVDTTEKRNRLRSAQKKRSIEETEDVSTKNDSSKVKSKEDILDQKSSNSKENKNQEKLFPIANPAQRPIRKVVQKAKSLEEETKALDVETVTKKLVAKTTSVPVGTTDNRSRLRSGQKKRSIEENDGTKKIENIPKRIRSKENVLDEKNAASNENKNQDKEVAGPKTNQAQMQKATQKFKSIKEDIENLDPSKAKEIPKTQKVLEKTTVGANGVSDHHSSSPPPESQPILFEDGVKSDLYPVCLICHQSEQSSFQNTDILQRNKSQIAQEKSRRSTANDSFINDWTQFIIKTFGCKIGDITTKINPSAKETIESIRLKKEEYKRKLDLTKTGVRFVLVISSCLIENLRIYFKTENDSVDLFSDLLHPLFEIESNQPQRFYPLILLDGSLGNKISSPLKPGFQYVRWSPSSANEYVHEDAVGLSINQLNAQFKQFYNDNPNAQQVDILKILQMDSSAQYKVYHSSDTSLETHKPLTEHCTSKPFIVRKPKNNKPKDVVDGRFHLIQHCANQDLESSFWLMHSRFVELMPYFNVSKSAISHSVFFDSHEDAITNKLESKRAEHESMLNNIKKLIHKKLAKDLNIEGITMANTKKYAIYIPGLETPEFEKLTWEGLYDIIKERNRKALDNIKAVADICVKNKESTLVLGVHARGDHDGFYLGYFPYLKYHKQAEELMIRYDDVVEIVMKKGVERLIIISANFDEHDLGKVTTKRKYKAKYPCCMKTGCAKYNDIPKRFTRIENSTPQYGIISACIPGHQLPRGQNSEFSPFLSQMNKAMDKLQSNKQVDVDELVQEANKLSHGTNYGHDMVTRDVGCASPKKTKSNEKYTSLFYYVNSFITKFKWQFKK